MQQWQDSCRILYDLRPHRRLGLKADPVYGLCRVDGAASNYSHVLTQEGPK